MTPPEPSPGSIDGKPGTDMPAAGQQAFKDKVDMMASLCPEAGFGDLKGKMNFGPGPYPDDAIGVRNYDEGLDPASAGSETKAIHDWDTIGLVPKASTGCADTAVSIAHEWRHVQNAKAAGTEKDESREGRSGDTISEKMENRKNNVKDACKDLMTLCKIASHSGEPYPKSGGGEGEVPKVSCKDVEAAKENLKEQGEKFNEELAKMQAFDMAMDVEPWKESDCPDIANDDCPCEDEEDDDGGGGGQ